MRLLFSAKKGGGQNAHLSAHGAEVVNCHPRLRRNGKKNAGAHILVLTRGVGLRAGTFFCKMVYFSLCFVGFILILFLFTKWKRPWKRFCWSS